MANLVFYMDYGPLLSRVLKSSFVVYMYYEKFQNDQGIVQLTYNELNDHLGLASSTIQKANSLLKRLELIEEVEDNKLGKRYKLLPVKKLTAELKAEILSWTKTEDYNDHTDLKKRYLDDDIPIEFQQLLNKKILKKAHKELGNLNKMKTLCEYFKIDYYIFKLFFEREGINSFGVRFKNLVKEIEQETVKPKKVSIGEQERELAKYLYDKLSSYDAKPIAKNWYIKNCKIAQSLLINISLEDAKATLDWGFNDDWWSTKITDLNCVGTLYSRYKLKSKGKRKNIPRELSIPDAIQSEIKKINSEIEVTTYGDAYLLRQDILDGQNKKEIVEIVNILEENGILPRTEKLKLG